jgi:hypothetical protein
MNHSREEKQQAQQDVDKQIFAEAPLQDDGDRWQENGDQNQGQLVHAFCPPRVRERASSR